MQCSKCGQKIVNKEQAFIKIFWLPDLRLLDHDKMRLSHFASWVGYCPIKGEASLEFQKFLPLIGAMELISVMFMTTGRSIWPMMNRKRN